MHWLCHYEDSSVNVTMSGLVLNFLSEQEKALVEMKRVTAARGTVALYVWDYAGKMDFLRYFWEAAVELDSQVSNIQEGTRFLDTKAEVLEDLFKKVGFVDTVITAIEIDTYFSDFDDYWTPFLGGQGPAPTYMMSLAESDRNKLRDVLYEHLPIQKDGSIPMVARAWAIKGEV
jgi:hypothetical protein